VSRRSTKQRRAAGRRRCDQRILRLNVHTQGDYYDPWGRPCGLGTWARWFESSGPERLLASVTLPNGYMVSTVWLGTDLGSWFVEGEPLIYESMVFRGLRALGDTRRGYATRRAALAGHRELVEEWSRRPRLTVA
jgi:hypothetical protein